MTRNFSECGALAPLSYLTACGEAFCSELSLAGLNDSN